MKTLKEQENEIKLLKEELRMLKASNQFDNLVKDERGKLIAQLKEELKREREGIDFYGKENNWLGIREGSEFRPHIKWIRIVEDDMDILDLGGKKAREIIVQRKIKSEDL